MPACAFAAVCAATFLLALVRMDGSWPAGDGALLLASGTGHGAGFGALVQRVAAVPAQYAASFSGVISTVIQLAVAIGIAAATRAYGSTALALRRDPAASDRGCWPCTG